MRNTLATGTCWSPKCIGRSRRERRRSQCSSMMYGATMTRQLPEALRRITDVTRSGGRIAIMDFDRARPDRGPLRYLYPVYRWILVAAGIDSPKDLHDQPCTASPAWSLPWLRSRALDKLPAWMIGWALPPAACSVLPWIRWWLSAARAGRGNAGESAAAGAGVGVETRRTDDDSRRVTDGCRDRRYGRLSA